MSFTQLIALAATTSVERLPVVVHGDAIAALQRNWPAVRAAQPHYSRLAKAIAKESDDGTVMLSSELLRTLSAVMEKAKAAAETSAADE